MSSKNKRRRKAEINNSAKNSSTNFIVRNGLAGLILIGLLSIVLMVPGYNWMLNSLIKGNLQIIKEYPNISIEEKYSMKFNVFGNLMNYIKRSTPENAIILIPDIEIVRPLINSTNQLVQLVNKSIILNFLYPRKIVMENLKEEEKYFNKITHVLIVNNYGYQYLNYEFNANIQLGVLPVNKEN